MLELNRELGTTFLFATHDRAVLDRTPWVIRMLDGRIVGHQSPTEESLSTPQLIGAQ